jgi:hypothetical protein
MRMECGLYLHMMTRNRLQAMCPVTDATKCKPAGAYMLSGEAWARCHDTTLEYGSLPPKMSRALPTVTLTLPWPAARTSSKSPCIESSAS